MAFIDVPKTDPPDAAFCDGCPYIGTKQDEIIESVVKDACLFPSAPQNGMWTKSGWYSAETNKFTVIDPVGTLLPRSTPEERKRYQDSIRKWEPHYLRSPNCIKRKVKEIMTGVIKV